MYKQLLIVACVFACFTLHSQNFLTPITNDFGLTATGGGKSSVSLGDLDNDGDLDLISGSTSNGFYYYQNIGDAVTPSFTTPVINPFNLLTPFSGSLYTPIFVDLDNDGDLDIVSGNNFGQFFYYENVGNASTPNFTDQVQGAFGMVESSFILSSPEFGDVDGDGDLDMFAGVFNETNGNFYYFENSGTTTTPSFESPIQDPFNLTWSFPSPSSGFTFPHLIDLDEDGDLDLISGSTSGDYYYYENSGNSSSPNYLTPLENPFNLTSSGSVNFPCLADIDNDGDNDILSGINSSDFVFLENGPAPATTFILDSNFEQYLIDQGIDTGGVLDGQVLTADLVIVDMVDLTALEISDLAGIQDFIALETLTLEGNPALDTIDISTLTNLTALNVKDTGLTFLDVSNNISLINLDVSGLTISSIDLSPLTSLISLSADNTNFAGIDISNNLLLEIFSASDAGLVTVDISNNIALTELNLSNNSLVNIDLTDNINLQILNLSGNNLETLDIVQNTNLTSIFANNNNLELAFLANGNNAGITGENFDITNNPSLACIAVDDANFANTNWPNKDADATYSENCLAVWTVYTTDTNFNEAIINSGADTNNDGEISYEEAQEYTDNINFGSLGITDVTGLEAFTNANIVDLSNNLIEDINSYLLSDSFIIELEFPSGRVNHDAIRRPKIRVKSLNVANNNLRTVDISNTEGMESLNVSGNDLESLTLAQGTVLNTRSTDNLTFMDARMNANLDCVQVNDVASAQGQASWFLDPGASYSTDCESALSTNDFSLETALNIGPNPTSDIIEINAPNHINLNSISLYSLNGQQLVSTNSNSLNIEAFGIGLYLLRIETDQGILVKKIIKN